MTDFSSSLKKDLTAEEFERFRDWIHKHSGIYLEQTKLDSLRISLVTRATRFGFVDHAEYYNMLIASDDEFKELMNLVTINETSFFRFPAQFDALRDLVIPEILAHKPRLSRSFRAWSAGCSTGEEPYTIAMTMLDSEIDRSDYRCEVLGTDVSTQALDRARQAIYPARSLASLGQPVVQRWFEPVAGGHRPIEPVRDIVDLSYHNLVKEPYPSALLANWDVIFCRNVTIYFRIESTRRVVENFYDSLNPGGYLFIGHSETLSTVSDRFEPVEAGGVFLYRKPLLRRIHTVGRPSPSRVDDTRRPTVAELSAANAGSPAATQSTRSPRDAGKVAPTGSQPRAVATGRRPAPVAAPASSREPALAGVVAPLTAPRREATPVATAEAPDPADVLIAEAQALLEQGRPLEARACAEQALALEPRRVEAILVVAYSHADSGDFEAAIGEVHSALAIDPLLAPARYVLGIIYQRQGDAAAALGEFRRTIYIDPEFVLAHFNAANIHRARGDVEEACREYENTLRSLYTNPAGSWTAFLGGFRPDLLAKTCERSLIECRKGT